MDVIAHPAGRMIGTRDDLDLEWDQVYAEAARTGTVLEMNGSPHRLDLAVERARRAVADGCLLSVDSDAHKTGELDYVRWGISQARRAWVEPANVLNTRNREDLLAWVAAKPTGREVGVAMSVSRTIPAMDDRLARRDLALAAMTVVGLSRLMEPPALWLVAVLLLVAMLFGTLQVLADESHPAEALAGVAIEALILPSVAAVACLGAIRLVPFGLWLIPALLVTGLLVAQALAMEARIHADQEDLSSADRTSLLVTILLIGFLGFTGVAAMVPGGLVQPTADGGVTPPIPETDLLTLAAGDAVIAFLLGYRAASLRLVTLRDALWSALTYAARDRDRCRRPARDGDPAPDGACPADAGLLPVGRVPRGVAGPPPRHQLDLADGPAGGPRGHRGRLEPAPARLSHGARRPPAFDVPAGRC